MCPAANMDVLTDEWVKKLQFENRVDLNLQIPASGESMKVEVGNVPPEHIPPLGLSPFGDNDNFTSLLMQSQQSKHVSDTAAPTARHVPTSDSYLSSIVSASKATAASPPTPPSSNSHSCQGTPNCPCYKCQRQRRRAGTRGRIISTEPILNSTYIPPTPTLKDESNQYPSQCSSTTSPTTSITSTESPTTPRPTVTRNGSFVLRKKPSSLSYERHLPRPTYSELDSIYREQHANNNMSTMISNHPSHQNHQQDSNDSYQISWQDETGDDILTSLRTFQTIFEENPHGSEGLSDLLEIRAQELRLQKIYEQEQQALMEQQQQMEPNRPPKRTDCLTLSYRDGPEHKHLTLYHTMKMTGATERMNAYGRAFQHCVRADSGLASWIEKQSTQACPTPVLPNHQSNLTLKKSTKRSLLHLPGRKQRNTAEDLWLRTNKLTDSFPATRRDSTTTTATNDNAPIDVLHTANALMPASSIVHQSLGKKNPNKKPYDYVDTPGRPLPRNRNSVDDSLASFDMEQPSRSTRSAKLWTTLGRKASRSHSSTSSTHSDEKVYHPLPSTKDTASEPFEEALDNLNKIMTHVDRSVLRSYLEQANGDYMKTLSILRADVTSGRL